MKVFITRKIPEPGFDLLRKEFEIEVLPNCINPEVFKKK
jgi:hypothetical protein